MARPPRRPDQPKAPRKPARAKSPATAARDARRAAQHADDRDVRPARGGKPGGRAERPEGDEARAGRPSRGIGRGEGPRTDRVAPGTRGARGRDTTDGTGRERPTSGRTRASAEPPRATAGRLGPRRIAKAERGEALFTSPPRAPRDEYPRRSSGKEPAPRAPRGRAADTPRPSRGEGSSAGSLHARRADRPFRTDAAPRDTVSDAPRTPRGAVSREQRPSGVDRAERSPRDDRPVRPVRTENVRAPFDTARPPRARGADDADRPNFALAGERASRPAYATRADARAARGGGRSGARTLPATPRTALPRASGAGQRIAKLLARAGVASRREIERMIAEGRVAIGGAVVETPATILASLAQVTVDGRPVQAAAPARLFRFHKPAGLLTTERDPAGRATIYDRLPPDLPRVMPVGRLDLNTEGLLLLTTDGELKRQLELPATGVSRTYRARVFGDISQAQLESLIEGIEIEGVRYGAIDANLERRTGRNGWLEMTLTEGKNREVRRVLEHLGLQVSRLIRTAYGPFPLADMPVGAVDEVRQHDLILFRRTLG